MGYEIIYSAEAKKSIQNIDKKNAEKIIEKIEQLSINPFGMLGVKKLKGNLKDLYRLRVGNFRILYVLRNVELIIFIVDIGHRKDIYD